MIKLSKLPKGYQSYSVLTLCSNRLLNGGAVIAVGDVPPLLIGKGSKPQIWLQALQSPQSKKFILLVDASISCHPMVRVEEVGRQIVVKANGVTILKVEQTEEDQAIVYALDLRPLGFNVFGDTSELFAGGMVFSDSTFAGGGVLVGVEA